MVFWISKSALPPKDSIDWLFETYAWLLAETGGQAQFEHTELVCPNNNFFHVDGNLEGHDLALTLFESTKKWAGMSDWPCRLAAHENDPSTTDLMGHVPFGAGVSSAGAAGTFRIAPGNKEIVEISYAAGSLEDPFSFVGTVAHELAHYLSATFTSDPPGGPDNWEFATDVCAVFLGFGIFIANSAFTFSQYQDHRVQGWSVSQRGYLSEQEIAYALAIFLALEGTSVRGASQYLDSNPKSYLKHAFRHVLRKRSHDLAKLGIERIWRHRAF